MTPTETPTPKTDAELMRIIAAEDIFIEHECDRMADFARILERELTASQAQVADQQSQIEQLQNELVLTQQALTTATPILAKVIAERDTAKSQVAVLREALARAIKGLQDWCDDVDNDASWDGWDHNFKEWANGGIKELEQALTSTPPATDWRAIAIAKLERVPVEKLWRVMISKASVPLNMAHQAEAVRARLIEELRKP